MGKSDRGTLSQEGVLLTDVLPHGKKQRNEKLVSQVIILNKLLSCILRFYR